MNAERKLIWTLWGIIFLFVLLWRFWPGEPTAKALSVELEIASELKAWFDSGTVIENQPSLLKVKLPLKDAVKHPPQTVHLGYSLVSVSGVAFNGTAPCPFIEGEASSIVALPNPKQVSARTVRLYLAR
jgi:hypothetical protein